MPPLSIAIDGDSGLLWVVSHCLECIFEIMFEIVALLRLFDDEGCLTVIEQSSTVFGWLLVVPGLAILSIELKIASRTLLFVVNLRNT